MLTNGEKMFLRVIRGIRLFRVIRVLALVQFGSVAADSTTEPSSFARLRQADNEMKLALVESTT